MFDVGNFILPLALEGEGCGCLAILAIIYAIVQVILLVLKYIVGAALSILAVIAGITVAMGLIVGLYYAFKCFFMALFEIKDDRKIWENRVLLHQGDSPRVDTMTGRLDFYESYVSPEYSSYFHGVLQKQIKNLIVTNFKNVFDTAGDCWKNVAIASGVKKVLSFVKNLITVVLLVGCGVVLSAVLGVIIVVFTAISLLVYWIFYLVCVAADRIYYSARKIESHCTNGNCKKVSQMPVYCCPNCGVPHRHLRPGKWGLFYRKCVCGEKLPCTANGKAKPSGRTKAEFSALCPECGVPIASHSRPLGVALLGGVNSGKSTFKTAFLFNFINETATLHDVKVEFPDPETTREFSDIEKYFRGVRQVPETRPDPVRGYDVKAFNFYMDHAKFTERRIIQMYDMPGEVFENDNAQDRMEHFSYVEGLVFLLDPYSMQSVSGMNGMGDMRIGVMDIDILSVRLINALKKVSSVKKHNKKFTIPVAVCINKVDTPELKKRIGPEAARKLMENHPKEFPDEFTAMDYLCRAFMEINDKGNAVMAIDQAFETVHYFSCSSMGYVPSGGSRVRFTPENVSAAVSWLFSRADRQFDKVFTEYNIKDVNETQKTLGRDNLEYYKEIETALTAAEATT